MCSAAIALIEVATIGFIGLLAKEFADGGQISGTLGDLRSYFYLNNIEIIYIVSSSFLFFIISKAIIIYYLNKYILNFVENENYLLKIFISKKLRSLSFEHVKKLNIDVAINAVVTNSNRYSNNYLLGYINLINNLTLLMLLSILMVLVNYKIAILVFFSMIFSGVMFDKIFKKRLKIDGEESVNANNMLVSRARDLIEHPIEVRVYKYLTMISSGFEESADKYRKSTISWLLINLSIKNYLELSILVLLLFIVLHSIFVGMSINELILVLTILGLSAFKALPAIGGILGSLTQIRFSLPSLEELICFKGQLELDEHISSKSSNLQDIKSVKFKSVGYEFITGRSLFSNINLELKSGNRLVIVGKSGSGKSTLLEIIAGMREPTTGVIELNNSEVAFFNSDWHNKIGYITTNPIIKSGSLVENIGADPSVLEDLDIYKDLNYELSNDGLSFMLDEQGKNISLGQKQRISFLRAICSGKKVLIMDEPTSALDSGNEDEIIRMINMLDESYIVIISTHSQKFKTICTHVIEL
jgi:ABC-type bacteriocin/lantibiotic exporter with double-glycine peptidase domain